MTKIPKGRVGFHVAAEDAEIARALVTFLDEGRRLRLALKAVLAKGDATTKADRAERTKLINALEMTEAKFGEVIGKSHVYSAITGVQVRLLKDLARHVDRKRAAKKAREG